MSTENRQYSCPHCDLTFPSLKGRGSHLKAHNKDLPCPICKKAQRYLGPHILRDHKDDPLEVLQRTVSELVEEVRFLRNEREELLKINNPS